MGAKAQGAIVTDSKEEILIKFEEESKLNGLRLIKVRFRLPEVPFRMLLSISGTLAGSDEQGFISRALIVDPPTSPLDVSKEDVASAWESLSSPSRGEQFRSVHLMLSSPKHSLALIAERLTPIKAVDSGSVNKLLMMLNSDSFTTRQAAIRELERLGDAVKEALEAELRNEPSEDAKRHLETLLARIAKLPDTPSYVQMARAIEVLERLGNKDAVDLLRSLAKGCPHAQQTRLAQEALKRLEASK